MSSIDERVVGMKFNGGQFQQGISTTLSSLDKLRSSLTLTGAAKGLDGVGVASDNLSSKLKLEGATKGLDGIGAAARNVSLAGISSAVDGIASKFSAMSIVGITALTNLTNKAMAAGEKLVKSFTVQPIKEGLAEYELKMGSIQTILSNTAKHGTKLADVNGALNELNAYSDKTIYNFGEMTKSVGLFTNSGMKLKDATAVVKGFSNEAAASGASAAQAAGASVQLSQGISKGKITMEEFRSLTNAGMGGANMKSGVLEIASAMGTLKDKGLSAANVQKDFNGTLEKGWLSADVMTNYLKIQAGVMTHAQMKTMGLSETQIHAFKVQQISAEDAATKVKTFSQLMGTLKESAGSGWAQSFEMIIGDFEQAKTLWTGVNKTLGGMIGKSAEARNKVLGDWNKKRGGNTGRTLLIEGIKNAFKSLMAIIKPIQDAFRNIFPAKTGQDLYNLTIMFYRFTKGLMIGGDTARKLNRTFSGVFALFSIGWEIIKRVGSMFGKLLPNAKKGAGGILDFTAKMGDFLIKVEHAIKKGDGLGKMFDKFQEKFRVPIHMLQDFGDALGKTGDKLRALGDKISGFFDQFKKPSFGGALSGLADVGRVSTKTGLAIEPVATIGSTIAKVWGKITGVFRSVWDGFQKLTPKIQEGMSHLGTAIQEAFGNTDYKSILATINTGLFAGMVLLLKKFMKDGMKFGVDADVGGGLFAKIKESFGGLTTTMKTMQTNIKADTLMKIAIAIGILTLSVVALALIDSAALTKALMAMTVMFTQLMVSMKVLEKGSTVKGSAKIAIMAGAMILLAIAVDLLCIAVIKLAKLSWKELGKGLAGLAAILAMLVAVTRTMGSNKNMISTGIGLALMGVGVRILVGAVADLGKLSWEELKKGLVGVGAVLGSLALFTRLASASKGGASQGVGLILLAVGMKILVGVVKEFAAFSWEEIGRGLAGMGGGLAIMAAALILIPPSSILSAVAILIVASSLKLIGDAIAEMGKMSWETIGKGMDILAGALLLIAGALALLPPSSLLSAVAILIVASSLKLIASALGTMGGMSWGEIAKGLFTLGAALTTIAITVTAMILALPGAIALVIVAGALAILAPILMLFGKMSWEEIGKGLTMLAGVFLIIGIAGALLTPVVFTLMGLGIAITLLGIGVLMAGVGVLAFSVALTALSLAGAAGAAAIVLIVSGLIGLIPLVMTQIGIGLVMFAQIIAASGPAIVACLTTIMLSLIAAIVTVIPKAVAAIVKLLTLLLDAIVKFIPKLVDAGMKLIIAILKGIGDNIGKIVTEGARILIEFLKGITKKLPDIIKAGADLIIAFIKGIGKAALDIVKAAAETLITFLNGLAKAIHDYGPEINKAGLNIAKAIVEGMVKGITDGITAVMDAAKNIAKGAVSAVKGWLGIHSPSKVFMQLGDYVAQGFAKGIIGGMSHVQSALDKMRTMIKASITGTQADVKSAQDKLTKLKAATGTKNIAVEKAALSLNTAKHAKKPNADAIKRAQLSVKQAKVNQKTNINEIRAAQTTLRQAQDANKKSINANNAFTASLKAHQNQLLSLGQQYEVASKKLTDAKQGLVDAQKTMADAAASITSSFSNLPDIEKKTKLSSYMKSIEKEIVDTNKFKETLDKLRILGMDDTTYNKLLGEGVSAQPFLDQLLTSGSAGVKQLNTLDKNLADSAGRLGNKAAKDLHQAGVNVAQGLVDGLVASTKKIETQMTSIATAMVTAIKKQLKIKSPSRVFAEIGKYSNEGLANGLSKYSNVVEKSAAGVGSDAINAMRKSISGMSGIVSGDMDLRPTITPVLDLTNVKKNAGLLDGLLAPPQISLDSTYASASAAAVAYRAIQIAKTTGIEGTTSQLDKKIEFIQNNYSPKALSSIEIYRQTKNQISAAKGALK